MSDEEVDFSGAWAVDAAPDGLFDAERALIDRLREAVPGLKTIDSSSLIAGSTSFTEHLPAAFVEPGGGTVDASASGYGELPLQQTWNVLLVVKHHRSHPGDTSAARLAGPLAAAIIRALNGWRPAGGFEPVLFTEHLDPISSVGWAMFELRFTVSTTIQA